MLVSACHFKKNNAEFLSRSQRNFLIRTSPHSTCPSHSFRLCLFLLRTLRSSIDQMGDNELSSGLSLKELIVLHSVVHMKCDRSNCVSSEEKKEAKRSV